ncbi:hypothetical protein ACX5I6_03315 [Arthrobacter sp. MMS24-T111]
MTTARNTHLNSAHARPYAEARPSTRQNTLGSGRASVDTGYVGKPTCDKCRTDEFVYLESYIPPRTGAMAAWPHWGKWPTPAPTARNSRPTTSL